MSISRRFSQKCVIALALVTLTACDQKATPFAAYRRPIDALASFLPLNLIDIYPCASRHKERDTDYIEPLPLDQCYKMQPARRFRGVWLDEFEGSTFFDGANSVDAVQEEITRDIKSPGRAREWLAWDERKMPPALSSSAGPARLVALDFIGRRTAYRGRYGHMGMSESEVIVDHVISAKPIYVSKAPYLENESTPNAKK